MYVFFPPLFRKPNEETQTWMGYVGQAIKTSASYLPSQMTEMLYQGRDHATARLPDSGLKNVCALAKYEKGPVFFPAHAVMSGAFAAGRFMDVAKTGNMSVLGISWPVL